MSRVLDVYYLDDRAGTLTQADDGQLSFVYATEYLAGRPRAISFSMPLTEASYEDRFARPFFSGLLPDEGARKRLAAALRISEGNAFGLLEIIGGECAGALSLYPAGQEPPNAANDGLEPLTPDRLQHILQELHTRPLMGGEDGVRLSLAGAQDKLAVCVEGDTIALAKGGRPTTHILKTAIEGLAGSIENELFCVRLAARMGLNAPTARMGMAGNTPYYLIERYDRHVASGVIERVHQEDFCQALSVPPELKYEDEGGPGVERSLDLVAKATAKPAAERLTFIRMLIFHYLVGNADAHAKNFALLYRGPTPDLAPIYDVLCTAAYKQLAKKSAMAIGGRNVPDTIQRENWLSLVPDTRGAQRLMLEDLRRMATAITKEADGLIAELHEQGIRHWILKDIRRVIGTRASHILQTTTDTA